MAHSRRFEIEEPYFCLRSTSIFENYGKSFRFQVYPSIWFVTGSFVSVLSCIPYFMNYLGKMRILLSFISSAIFLTLQCFSDIGQAQFFAKKEYHAINSLFDVFHIHLFLFLLYFKAPVNANPTLHLNVLFMSIIDIFINVLRNFVVRKFSAISTDMIYIRIALELVFLFIPKMEWYLLAHYAIDIYHSLRTFISITHIIPSIKNSSISRSRTFEAGLPGFITIALIIFLNWYKDQSQTILMPFYHYSIIAVFAYFSLVITIGQIFEKEKSHYFSLTSILIPLLFVFSFIIQDQSYFKYYWVFMFCLVTLFSLFTLIRNSSSLMSYFKIKLSYEKQI